MNFISKQFDFKKSEKTILIGEIGVNHNGDKKLLFDLIDQGILSGIDILKFQRFKSEEEISIFAESADYQKNANQGDSQLELAKKLELPDEWLLEVFDYCKKKKVGFLCTAFDFSSVDFIADELKCSSIKVPSPQPTSKTFEFFLISLAIILNSFFIFFYNKKYLKNFLQHLKNQEHLIKMNHDLYLMLFRQNLHLFQ